MSANSFRLDSACLPLYRLAAFEQTILDGIQDLMLVLAPDGLVLHASSKCFGLTTFTCEHLTGNYIANFMHYDDMPVFLTEFNATMAAGTPWRFRHRLRKADGTFAVFESTFNPFFDSTSSQPAEYFGLYKCVMTIRPYSNPSVVLMDSYLDHFTTNTRLVEQLKQLRSETDDLDEDEHKEEQGREVVQESNNYLSNTAKTKHKVSSIHVLLDLTNILLQYVEQISCARITTKSNAELRPGQQPKTPRRCSGENRKRSWSRGYRYSDHCLTPRDDQKDRFMDSQTMREEDTEGQKALRPYLHSVRDERIAGVAHRSSRQEELV